MRAVVAKALPLPFAIVITSLFGGMATVLAAEFPYTSVAPPTLSYFVTQLIIFSLQIAILCGAGILVFGWPCWSLLRARGMSGWRTAMALGAALGLILGATLVWALPYVLPLEPCQAFNTCRVSAIEVALDVLRFVALCGLVPSFTALVLWRLTRETAS